ncbi:MAG: hypothetical protein V5A76_01085 [Candidatus Thermoplasmatota archaeon]
MPQNFFRDQETGLGEEFNSRFKEIQKRHAGKFLAIIDSDEILLNDNYVKLLRELEKKDVDLKSVTITNIPPIKE